MFKRMQNKIIVVISIFALILIAGLTLLRKTEQNKISLLLANQQKEKSLLLNKIIDFKSKSIESFAFDYTYWDEMLKFVKSGEIKWAKENIEASLPTYNADVAWVYKTDLALLYSTNRINVKNVVNFPLSMDILRKIVSTGNFYHFFVLTEHGVMEINGGSIHPTFDIKRKTAPQGYFFVGQLWNEKYLKEISILSETNVRLVQLGKENIDTKVENSNNYIINNSMVLKGWDSLPIINVYSTGEILIAKNLIEQSEIQYSVSILFALFIIFFIAYVLFKMINQPLKFISESLATGNPNSIARLLYKNDEFGTLANMINDFFNQKNKLMEEIAERKRIEEELKKAKEIAETANRAKSEFLANMSHEIRTPMNAILGFADIISNKISDPTLLNYLNIIQTSGDTLMSLINDILDISKIEAGKYELNPRFISLKKILLDLQLMFSQKIHEKGLKLFVEIDNNLPSMLYLDEVRIRQILLNLISNSIKFTETGYIKFSLNLKHTDVSKNRIDIIITVEDTGIGIPKDQLQSIFKPFEQVVGQSTKKFGGTGLGLAIVANLIQKIGGNINVESEIGKGTSFTVILNDIEVNTESGNENSSYDLSSKLIFEQQNILIVDDIEYNRTLLKTYLDELKLDVVLADNGEKVLDLVKNITFNLFIIDVRMPGISGFDLAKILSEDENTKNIPRIAYTASAFREQEEKVHDYFDGYLRKPINKKQLLIELKKYLKYREDIVRTTTLKNEEEFFENKFEKLSITPDEKQKLIDHLENLFLKDWNNISNLIEMNSIIKFSSELRDVGLEYKVNSLIVYAEKLLDSAKMVKIKRTKELLKLFPDIIKLMKN